MIKGLDKFREYFSDFGKHYALIGGAASDLLMEDAGVTFRATKDLDIVLCVEALDKDFANAFWAFIEAGGYKIRQRSTGERIFYRFNEPEDESFPLMLELFSRNPDTMVLGDDSHLTPIPIADDVYSLSAILMDEDYYGFLHEHKIEIDGVFVVSQACLIPLKAKSWLDLNERKKAGDSVDSRDVKKHKNDIFRLFQILSPESRINLPDSISCDMQYYLRAISKEPDLDLKPFGLKGLSVIDLVSTLRKIYGIPEQKPDDNA